MSIPELLAGSRRWAIEEGDALEVLGAMPEGCAQMAMTSPPYWGLRDYGQPGQIGLETTPEEYVAALVAVFHELRRVLRDNGTLWLNLGDSYTSGASGQSGTGSSTLQSSTSRCNPTWIEGVVSRTPLKGHPALKPKDLVGIPWRVAFALQADGWYLRSDIIWAKPNPMPESVTDRPTKAHEYLFLLAKSERYKYDGDAIAEDAVHAGESVVLGKKSLSVAQANGLGIARSGNALKDRVVVAALRNRRTVWTIPTQPFAATHFAVFPPALVEPCVLAGSAVDDVVLDPFAGAGTVGVVCRKHQRRFVGIELRPEYARMARGRLGEDTSDDTPLFSRDVA